MKKILSSCLFAALVILFAAAFILNAQAAGMEKNISGSVTKLAYQQSGNTEEIRIYTSHANILRQFVLEPNSDCKNYRIGIEITDAVIQQNGAFDINQGSVYQIRYANKQNPQAASIVIETTKKPDYTIKPSGDGKYLSVILNGSVSGQPAQSPAPGATSGKPASTSSPATTVPASNSQGTGTLGPVSVTVQGNTCLVRFEGINLNTAFGNTGKKPAIELREKEKILQVTLPGQDSRFSEGFIPGNSVVYGVLVSYNKELNSTIIRIVFDDAVTYTHEISGSSSVLKINRGSSGNTGSTGNTGVTSPTTTPAPAATNPPQTGNDTSRSDSSRASVNASFSGNSVTITAASTSGYRIYTAGDPSRIVIEVPGTVSPGEKTMGSGALYQKAVLSQMNASTARIELYAWELPQWTVDESATGLKVNLNRSGAANIQAGDGDDVALKLIGTNIVGKYRKYADKIIAENDVKNNAYAFMFPADLIDLGQGSVNINNALISTVTTLTTPSSSFLKIEKKDATKEFSIVEGSSSNELLIVAKSGSETPSKVPASNNTGIVGNINIRNPQSSARGKLVVLDAGHGGSDPGAEFSGYLEKDFNLDITLKLEAILKQKGINVKMTRSTDVFVGLEERAEMANSWGADLFVSIHNNSMHEGMKGSMTFYYPTSYKGKTYAKMILDNMYDKLNMGAMGSSGLRSANYVVLRQTKMPAVLVEVACMSHPDDLNLLKSEAFRQKTAEVLADSIIQILNQM